MHTDLDAFCDEERSDLVAALTSYCGDRDVAEDVAQEALARAAERWEEISSPGPWVYRTSVNLVNTLYRRRAVERRVVEQLADPEMWHRDRDAATIVAVRRAVGLLPARQRAVVALRYLLDWPVGEVADAMSLSEGAVRALAHRGMTALREHFEAEGRERSSRVVTSGGAVVILLMVVAVLVAVAERTSEPSPVFIDDSIPAIDGLVDRPPTVRLGRVEATVTGDLNGRFVLEGPDVLGVRPDVVDRQLRDVLRFGARDRALIHFSVPPAEGWFVTGEGVTVLLVLDGHNFLSVSGECMLDIERVESGETVTGEGQLLGVSGVLTCEGLEGGSGGRRLTIDVHGAVSP